MKKIRTAGLAALLVLVSVPWTAEEARSHPRWPTNLNAAYRAVPPFVAWPEQKQVVDLTFRYEGLFDDTVDKIYVNWCRAKTNLPDGWSTQSNRELRYNLLSYDKAMCSARPAHSGFGLLIFDKSGGEFGVTRSDKKHVIDPPLGVGRWVFGVTFWTHYNWPGHHAGGHHTTLKLVELEEYEWTR